MKPLTLTLALAIPLGAMLSAVNQVWVHDKIPGPSVQNHFWVQKTFTDSAFDVVLMGDSRTYNAVSPVLLAESLPGSHVLNFGYADGGFNPLMFRAVASKFRRGKQPKILVLGITPNSLTPKKGALNLRYLEQISKKPDFVFAHLHLTPWLRHLDSFEPTLLIDRHFNAVVDIQREYHEFGWMAETWIPPKPAQQIPIFKEKFHGNTADPLIESTLLAQVDAWASQGYIVFGYRPPNTATMAALEDSISGFDYARFIPAFEKSRGRWLSLDASGLVSFDGSHIDKPSALIFTRRLGEAIRLSLTENPPAGDPSWKTSY